MPVQETRRFGFVPVLASSGVCLFGKWGLPPLDMRPFYVMSGILFQEAVLVFGLCRLLAAGGSQGQVVAGNKVVRSG